MRRRSSCISARSGLMLCIVLFPIGLLALLARPTETITITATEADGKVRATATGSGDQRVLEAVKIVFATCSRSSTASRISTMTAIGSWEIPPGSRYVDVRAREPQHA